MYIHYTYTLSTYYYVVKNFDFYKIPRKQFSKSRIKCQTVGNLTVSCIFDKFSNK